MENTTPSKEDLYKAIKSLESEPRVLNHFASLLCPDKLKDVDIKRKYFSLKGWLDAMYKSPEEFFPNDDIKHVTWQKAEDSLYLHKNKERPLILEYQDNKRVIDDFLKVKNECIPFLPVPDPPPVDVKDFPRVQRIKSTPPIQYNAAGDLVNDVNVILVTANGAEFCAVMGQAKPLRGGNEYHTISLEDHTTFYLANYGQVCQNKVAIIRTEQGARETRLILDRIQKTLQAQYVIAVGICYGLDERKVKLGDVIVSKSIIDTSSKKTQVDGLVSIQSQDKAGTYLYNVFRQGGGFELKSGFGDDDYVDVKSGVLVSETTLVAHAKHKDQILKQIPHALGGEMEGAGIMESAGANDYEGIVIKAVANYGDANKREYEKWQPFAAFAAAKYVWFHLDRNNLKRAPVQQPLVRPVQQSPVVQPAGQHSLVAQQQQFLIPQPSSGHHVMSQPPAVQPLVEHVPQSYSGQQPISSQHQPMVPRSSGGQQPMSSQHQPMVPRSSGGQQPMSSQHQPMVPQSSGGQQPMSSHPPSDQPMESSSGTQSLSKEQIKEAKVILKKVLKENEDALREIFRASQAGIINHMARAEIIGTADANAPTYDVIMGAFERGLLVKKKQSDLEQYCNKFLQAFGNAGGNCKDAAEMLKGEWSEEVHKAFNVNMDLKLIV